MRSVALHRRIFLGAFAFNTAITVFWLVTWLRGGSFFFSDYRVDWATIRRILSGVLFFYVMWGIPWWAIKSALLRYLVGFTKEERREAFSSRMSRPYDVHALVAKYSERRIRIADMIGRRGRFFILATAGFYYLYLQTAQNQNASFATAFLQDNLLDGVITSWIFLSVFYVNGPLGAWFYGPQSRVMDGVLARANCLLITTLWTAFKFVMVPLGLQLAAVFPRTGVRGRLRAHLGVVHRGGWECGDRRIAVWRSAAARLGRGRHQQKIGRRNGRGISRTARSVRGHCHGARSRRALAGALADPRRLELPARAVLASRHRRFHDGNGQRADLLGVRRLAVLKQKQKGLQHSLQPFFVELP